MLAQALIPVSLETRPAPATCHPLYDKLSGTHAVRMRGSLCGGVEVVVAGARSG